ncbi:MAG TPA: peptide-methionine (S)-S-oxide reductase MsrA [Thermoplasmata archaeon]|nr:peptide-methionine (S)-S-oxide reductase MsrA [Thermoplasmata archaeon]
MTSEAATEEVAARHPRNALELATLGGGCFWCTEAVFQQLQGVTRVEPGYAGGTTDQPTYEDVCTGTTGHAEVVQVEFDPNVLSYGDLLRVFFSVHDPTTLNRQGGDTGTQYRSIVLYHSPAQKQAAQAVMKEFDTGGFFRGRLVTELVPFTKFFPAEEYHHNYFQRNPDRGYCQMVISPKLSKFRHKFADRLKTA